MKGVDSSLSRLWRWSSAASLHVLTSSCSAALGWVGETTLSGRGGYVLYSRVEEGVPLEPLAHQFGQHVVEVLPDAVKGLLAQLAPGALEVLDECDLRRVRHVVRQLAGHSPTRPSMTTSPQRTTQNGLTQR